jgi:hypothetical protein
VAIKYKLKSAIVLGDETIEVLELEEPTQEKLEMYDFDYSELTKAKGLKKLVCACVVNCGESHIAKMKPIDIAKAGTLCSDFFE